MFNDVFHTTASKIKNLVTLELDELTKEYEDLLSSTSTLSKVNQELRNNLTDLETRHAKLKQDYLAMADSYSKLSVPSATSSTTGSVMFDPAIHSVKSPRPITRVERDSILSAYETIYKSEDCKTLPEFFSYVQLNICSHASRTEIEGVIYNRFDLRLYK